MNIKLTKEKGHTLFIFISLAFSRMSLRHVFSMGWISPKEVKHGSWEGSEKNLSYCNGYGLPKSCSISKVDMQDI